MLAYEGPHGVQAAAVRVRPEIGAAVLIPDGAGGDGAGPRRCCPIRCRTSTPPPTPGGAALLVHALAEDPDRLWDATRDWLHQQYREPAMPRSYALVTALRAAGYAAVISGAGPTVLVLGTAAQLAGLEDVPAPGFALRRCGVGTGAQLGKASHYGNIRQGC